MFEAELIEIHKKLTTKNIDCGPYMKIVDDVRNWLLRGICEVDETFYDMITSTKLYGSYINNLCIIEPTEVDMFILLERPCNGIRVQKHSIYAGYVEIKKHYSFNEENSNNIQGRMQDVIEEVINEFGSPPGYNIEYERLKVAHRITVKKTRKPYKKISINFVLAIELHANDIYSLISAEDVPMADDDYNTFMAVPYYMPTSQTAFQLINPDAEYCILWGKQNLKVVYRLLKSLCNNYSNLYCFESYFLTTLFLFEVNDRSDEYWHNPIGKIFLEMLDSLIESMENYSLICYWSPTRNLLCKLTAEEIEKCTSILTNAYNRLLKISSGKKVTYSVKSHFKTSL